ncbi:unnamed protein product, partial [Ectocarpus sp. 12 AP-2014]
RAVCTSPRLSRPLTLTGKNFCSLAECGGRARLNHKRFKRTSVRASCTQELYAQTTLPYLCASCFWLFGRESQLADVTFGTINTRLNPTLAPLSRALACVPSFRFCIGRAIAH